MNRVSDPWSLPSEWLAAREQAGLLRTHRAVAPTATSARTMVGGRSVINFASNDYLGLAHHPEIIAAWQQGATRWGVGSGASALVCGYSEAHEAVEEELAQWLGFPAARLFTSGYAANLAVVQLLTSEAPHETAIFADKLVHASLIDALLLARARGATVRRYPHSDTERLAKLLAACDASVKLIVTDGVFSMDGDVAPLAALAELARTHRAWLIVDDAHGFGLLGDGRGTFAHWGLTPEPHWLWVATFGKAAGVAGAAVLGSRDAIAWLDQSARTHIYTTAMPPAQAEALAVAVHILATDPEPRRRLFDLISQWQTLSAAWRNTRAQPLPSPTAIQPLVVGSAHDATALAAALEAAGFWVPAIRPPTVPPNTARLRISLSAAHERADVEALADAITQELTQRGFAP